eukprot:scaffold1658_cov393-Prasinococcus_capsulatus_cf.AAC.3
MVAEGTRVTAVRPRAPALAVCVPGLALRRRSSIVAVGARRAAGAPGGRGPPPTRRAPRRRRECALLTDTGGVGVSRLSESFRSAYIYLSTRSQLGVTRTGRSPTTEGPGGIGKEPRLASTGRFGRLFCDRPLLRRARGRTERVAVELGLSLG